MSLLGSGGQCDTDLDCKNKGLCLASKDDEKKMSEDDDKVFGKCFCFEGRSGKNCGKCDVLSQC